MKLNRKANYLRSRIVLKATIATGMDKVDSRMSFYPHATRLREDRSLKYMIKAATEETFYVVDMRRDAITFDVYSLTSPLYSMRETVLRVISICSILSDDYRIDANSLLPYVTNALLRMEPETRAEAHGRRDTERTLASRIISLLSANRILKDESARIRNDLVRITAELIASRYSANSSHGDIARMTQLSSSIISEALEVLNQNGYKVLYNSKGSFDVVKI